MYICQKTGTQESFLIQIIPFKSGYAEAKFTTIVISETFEKNLELVPHSVMPPLFAGGF